MKLSEVFERQDDGTRIWHGIKSPLNPKLWWLSSCQDQASSDFFVSKLIYLLEDLAIGFGQQLDLEGFVPPLTRQEVLGIQEDQ